VIATGGLAPLLAEGTMVIEHIDPDLTLDGLRMLAEQNRSPNGAPTGHVTCPTMSDRGPPRNSDLAFLPLAGPARSG